MRRNPLSTLTDRPRPWVRFAFCKKMETLEKAIERLSKLRVRA